MDGWIFHRVSNKLSEGNYEFDDVPKIIKTIDFLLGVEEDDDNIQENLEAIGDIFSNIDS